MKKNTVIKPPISLSKPASEKNPLEDVSLSQLSEETVRSRLGTVIDPELGVDIVRLGLIYKIDVRGGDEVDENNSNKVDNKTTSSNTTQPKVAITMTLTTPGCPLAGIFDQLIRDALYGLPGVDVDHDVVINLTFDPPWVPDMMDEDTKIELGIE